MNLAQCNRTNVQAACCLFVTGSNIVLWFARHRGLHLQRPRNVQLARGVRVQRRVRELRLWCLRDRLLLVSGQPQLVPSADQSLTWPLFGRRANMYGRSCCPRVDRCAATVVGRSIRLFAVRPHDQLQRPRHVRCQRQLRVRRGVQRAVVLRLRKQLLQFSGETSACRIVPILTD